MLQPWAGERRRFFTIVILGSIVGLVFGDWLLWFLLTALLYLLWQFLQLKKLLDWLRRGANPKRTPDLTGAWDPVVRYIYTIQRRNNRRKSRMRKLLQRFEQITLALPDATIVVNADCQIEWSNQTAAYLLGVQHPADVGQRVDNLIRDPEFKQYLIEDNYQDALTMMSPVMEDVELSIRIIPFGNNDKLISARDISTFMRVQAMRRNFVANVSHELRTPLTVISGYLEPMLDDSQISDEYQKVLKSIRAQSDRMQHIVEDLLELSRLESNELVVMETEVPVSRLLSVLYNEAEQTASGNGQTLIVESDEDLGLLGSEKELFSMMANLIYNALRHTQAGTEVRVMWRKAKSGAAVFQVQDNGPGIDAEHLPRLTERFYRVDAGRSRDAGGSGLGLAIVKHIVQRHGGYLQIDSAVGSGSSFTVYFPAMRVVSTESYQSA